MTTIAPAPGEWESLRTRTVFFGHQSIGENVLDGVRQLARDRGWASLRIAEGLAADTGPVLLHAKVGQNGDPSSKIREFQQALNAGLGAQADIALLKFCFWDIKQETDIDKLFEQYGHAVTEIGERFPYLTLVHATVPLVVEDNDWRARARRLLGMAVPTDEDNAKREALNRKIREAYSARLFDIARAEQGNDATREGSVPHLSDTYSSDGAHLNEVGRKRVAVEFVRALAAAAGDRSER